MLQVIRDQVLSDDTPDFVLMQRDDIAFLLAIIKVGEELYRLNEHGARQGSKASKRLKIMWEALLFSES